MLLTAQVTLLAAVPDGSYQGRLEVAGVGLTIRLNFSNAGTEKPECTLDSPDQGAYGIPAEVVSCDGDRINLRLPALRASYDATLRGDTLKGVFSQNGMRLPLTMVASAISPLSRPQTPRPPYPYVTKEIVVRNDKAGAELSGTLTLPPKNGAAEVPAVVFVSGSGLQDRDEEAFGHKPFLVIADYLARNGIASLRYDDRGYGKSSGDAMSATTFDFREDAAAAINFLRSTDGIGEVGVIGHSEGGLIAFMLAADKDTDFIVTMGAPVVDCKDIILAQNRHNLSASGMPQRICEEVLKLVDSYLSANIESITHNDTTSVSLVEVAGQHNINLPQPVIAKLSESDAMESAWFRKFITIRPSDYIKEIACPTLVINGTLDTQVDADSNLALMASLLPQARISRVEGLNHLLQTAQTGEVSEYASIEETISPEALSIITEFIKGLK